MVSVIIPNYNSKKMLVNCVKSVFEQGALVEAIVVDDASDDNSISLLESFIEGYEGTICKTFSYEDNKCYISYEIMQKLSDNSSGVGSLRILKNESNKGVAFSRNKAISICSGEYVAFLDADDYWDSTKLVKQLRLLEEDKAAVLCNTARELIEEDGKSTGRIIETPSRITLNMLKRTNYINCSSVLIRTDIIKKYPEAIVIEGIKNPREKWMIKGANAYNKRLNELALTEFLDRLKYKCEWCDIPLIEADISFPSTKMCSCCGNLIGNELTKDRMFICSACGHIEDRDINAACNLRNLGENMIKKSKRKKKIA